MVFGSTAEKMSRRRENVPPIDLRASPQVKIRILATLSLHIWITMRCRLALISRATIPDDEGEGASLFAHGLWNWITKKRRKGGKRVKELGTSASLRNRRRKSEHWNGLQLHLCYAKRPLLLLRLLWPFFRPAMARIQTAEITFENVAICCSSKRASLE